MLDELINLSQNAGPDQRRQLLTRITDQFLKKSEEASDLSTELFVEVTSHLLGKIDADDRAAYAANFADSPAMPQDIARKLACDTADIAEPVLEKSLALSDTDLVEIAGTKSQQHLMAMTRRKSLAECVTDAIIEHGDEKVLVLATQNSGARFSHDGFTRMTKKAHKSEDMKDALSKRADMPVEIAEKFVASLSGEAKKRLEKLIAENGDKAAALIREALKDTEKKVIEGRRMRLDAKLMVQDVIDGELSMDEAYSLLAAQNRDKDLAYAMAAISKVPRAHIDNSLLAFDGTAIAILCKVMTVSPEAFCQIALLRQRRMPESDAAQLVSDYTKLSPESADKAIRFLKLRQSA